MTSGAVRGKDRGAGARLGQRIQRGEEQGYDHVADATTSSALDVKRSWLVAAQGVPSVQYLVFDGLDLVGGHRREIDVHGVDNACPDVFVLFLEVPNQIV